MNPTTVVTGLALAGLLFMLWQRRERFMPPPQVQVSWQPPVNYPTQNLVYDWGICYDITAWGTGPSVGYGLCSNTGVNPLGDPSQWHYHGTTSDTSLNINGATCDACSFGQSITLMLRARDTSDNVSSQWMKLEIDLTQPTSPPTNITINSSTGGPFYVGSTGVQIVVDLSTPFASDAKAEVGINVIPPGGGASAYTEAIPMSVSGNQATAVIPFTGPQWISGAGPGSILSGATLTADVVVYETGGESAPVTYASVLSVQPSLPPLTLPTSVGWKLA